MIKLKPFTLILLLLFAPLSLLSQSYQEREVEPFTQLRIFGNIHAILVPGDEPKVMIESTSTDPDNVHTKVEEDELRIRLRKNLFKDEKVIVKIAFQELNSLTTLADAEVDVEEPIIRPFFYLKATSGSHVKMTIETEKLDVEAYQGGQGEINGKTDSLNAYVNTGGILSATDLTVQNADIKMNTGGKGEITVQQSLKARINTGANFSYYGKPKNKIVDTSLGGSVSALDEKEQ